jgi:glutamyl/glutaminyl-tRNA synthetase
VKDVLDMPEKIVTRFAPSPTGYLHIGGARTALFNWLFAKKMRGTFILRIEDTDQKRNTPTAIQQVIDDLRWLGIQWDEGPRVGGPHGPYLQSQRLDIYNKYAKKLIVSGLAYYCFDTPEELDAMRKEAEAKKSALIYRRPEKLPDESDVEKAKAQGRPVTVRFAIPQGENIIVNDIVRGEVSFAAAEISDFIIIKSDDFPTYNFAVVVDDALMEVTHVIRGQEHLMNTPGQQVLWRALFPEKPLPQYAHMSVTISEGGGKLSKRERPKALRNAINAKENIDLAKLAQIGKISVEELQSFIDGKTTPDMTAIDAMAGFLDVTLPEINVVDFFRSGYIPEAMVNFLALLGWNPGTGREIMPLDELIASIDITRLTKTNSLFDRGKLLAFNTEHMRIVSPEKLLKYFKDFLKAVNSPLLAASDEILKKLLQLSAGARTLADVEHKCRFLFLPDDKIEYDEKTVKKVLLKDKGRDILPIVRDKIASMRQLTSKSTEDMLRNLADEKHVKLGNVAQPLRVAICGTAVSTPIFESVEMLGKEKTLARIDKVMKIMETTPFI